MFKFIHTSDWHLGQNFYGYDRSEEQRAFLSKLTSIVRKHKPDALLVSGDIYHTATPSNATVALYVQSMLEIHQACPSMEIIVIAGNHDSASRLDSDSSLWKLAKVTVLGGIARKENGLADLEHHIIKVGDKGIVAAVPFAFSSGFPNVTTEALPADQHQRAYFQALLNRANRGNIHQELPVVLMAHLTVKNCDITGHDNLVMMDSVDVGTLGQGYDYAALGHIHHPQDVTERARYCGTPLAVSFDEQCEHSVSIVEIDQHGAMPRIETRHIRNIKPLHTIPPKDPVPFDEALQLLQELDPEEPAYIRLNVSVDRYLPHGAQERTALALANKACRFCEIKKTLTTVVEQQATQMTVEEFNTKSPIDIANQYYKDKLGEEMSEEQKKMFNHIFELVQKENRQ